MGGGARACRRQMERRAQSCSAVLGKRFGATIPYELQVDVVWLLCQLPTSSQRHVCRAALERKQCEVTSCLASSDNEHAPTAQRRSATAIRRLAA